MVVSYGQLLERKFPDWLDDEAHAYIGYMVEGGVRMQAMVSALLEFSRVDRGGEERTPFDSGKAVEEALFNLSRAITEAGAEIGYSGLPEIVFGRHQFVRLIQNLIGNAIKYRASAPPRIMLAARRDGPRWVFSLSDNGIGIDPAYFEQIFAIFRRLHTRDEYGGTGIGLAVCKKIVEHHGGRIWVDSTPGTGSTFFFTVPDP